MPWTPSGVSSLKSVTVNVPWETIISAWTFDQPEKVSAGINLVSMFGLFLCWAYGTFNIQPVASISFLLGKCTPHLSYCLCWNRATSPEKRRGGKCLRSARRIALCGNALTWPSARWGCHGKDKQEWPGRFVNVSIRDWSGFNKRVKA